MEQAFHRLARAHLANTEHLHHDWSLTREYELSAALPAMSHLWRVPGHALDAVAAKGAPEAIVDLCHLDEDQKARVFAEAAAMADDGLRVLGVAKAQSGDEAGAVVSWQSVPKDSAWSPAARFGIACSVARQGNREHRDARQRGRRDAQKLAGRVHDRSAGSRRMQRQIQPHDLIQPAAAPGLRRT